MNEGVGLKEGLESKFDMTVADMQIIDMHRRDAHKLFLLLRNDVRGIIGLLDSLQSWYLVLMPYCIQFEKDKYEKLFDEAYSVAQFELNRLKNLRSNEGSVVFGASPELFKLVKELISEMYILKNKKGLGIKQIKTFKKTSNAFASAVK